MKTKTIRLPFDLSNPPPITPEIRENLAHIDTIKEEDIDLTEMPELDDNFFRNALSRDEFFSHFRALKHSTTVRIDADVLHWLKKDGKGYQSRLNAILRKEMMQSLGTAKSTAPTRKAKVSQPARATPPATRRKLSA